MSNEKGEILA